MWRWGGWHHLPGVLVLSIDKEFSLNIIRVMEYVGSSQGVFTHDRGADEVSCNDGPASAAVDDPDAAFALPAAAV